MYDDIFDEFDISGNPNCEPWFEEECKDEFFKDFDQTLDEFLNSKSSINDCVQENILSNPKAIQSDIPTDFREKYYEHFTGEKNKPARKELILKYHLLIVKKHPDIIRPAKRDEQRDISKYFQSFAPYSSLIIQTIIELENENKIDYKNDHQILKSKKYPLK